MRARTDEAGLPDAHLDLAEPAVAALVLRVIADQVIGAVVLDDAVEGGAEVVRIQRREAAGLVGEHLQAVLRAPQLGVQRLRPEAQRRILGQRLNLDGLIGHRRQPARIDRSRC